MVEVDVFKGKLRGLIIVEMEKPEDLSAKVFRKAKPSDWWGIEITGDSKWSNYTLAMRTGK
jgi:CYTH domain-containing protein